MRKSKEDQTTTKSTTTNRLRREILPAPKSISHRYFRPPKPQYEEQKIHFDSNRRFHRIPIPLPIRKCNRTSNSEQIIKSIRNLWLSPDHSQRFRNELLISCIKELI